MGSFVQVTSCDLRVDNYDFIKSFISNFVMIFSLSRHGRKYWLTRLHCGGENSLLIISYANFLTVFRQFSDDSKYLSSCHKEMITARICSLKGDAYFLQIAIATGFTCITAADKLRFTFSNSQCLLTLNRSFPLFFLFFLGGGGWRVVLFLLQKAEIC